MFGYACGTSPLSFCLPSDMLAAATDLDGQIRAVMADVDANRDVLDAATEQGWDSFVDSWEVFTEQDQGSGEGWLYGSGVGDWWTSAGVSMSAINGKLEELTAWRATLERSLGRLSSPAPPAATPPGYDPLGIGSIGKVLPWLAGGVLLVLLLPVILPKRG